MNQKRTLPAQLKNEKAIWKQCRVQLDAPGHCPEATLLAAYLDQGLSENERNHIETHLVQCRDCLDTILFVKDLEDDIHQPVRKKDIAAASRLITPKQPPRTRRNERLSGWFFPLPINPVFTAALLVLVCITGFYLGHQTGTNRMFVRNVLATELQFGLDLPLTDNNADREDG
jgi:hypothetical protein